MQQQQAPVLNIQMVPAGIELTIAALRKLPHDQVDDLVKEIWAQYSAQMQQLQVAAAKPAVPAETAAPAAEPAPAAEIVDEATGLTD